MELRFCLKFVLAMPKGLNSRTKVEMYYLEEYTYYCNNKRIYLKLKEMSPVQYRALSQSI